MEKLKIVDEQSINKIHEASLRLLEQTGMIVEHGGALELLGDSGCKVDLKEKRVWFLPDLIMEQIKKVPKEVTLGGREEEHDIILGGKNQSKSLPFTRSTCGIEEILDYKTNKVRGSNLSDFKDFVILSNALPNIDYCGVLSPVDVDLASRDVTGAGFALRINKKHLHSLAYNGKSVDYLSQFSQVIRGSKEEAAKRPPISFFQVSISPMHLSKDGVDCIISAGKNSVPVFLNSSPIMGATAPLSIAGCVALLNAEILAMNAILQLSNPNSSMIYTIRPSIIDMKTGLSLWGAIEVTMASALSVQLAKEKYGFITDIFGPCSDSKIVDIQSAMERTWMSFLPVLAGTDMICGAGSLNFQITMSLPQMVIDDELMAVLKRTVKGVLVNDSELAVDVIDKIGPKGNFLGCEHTFERFRNSLLEYNVLNRAVIDNWETNGKQEVNGIAKKRLEDIVDKYEIRTLDSGKIAQIEKIEKEAIKNIHPDSFS